MDEVRLLIVDDHPIIEQGLLLFLEQYPHIRVVDTAKDAMTGLEMLRQHKPDIVLLDLNMPKLDGLEAIRLYLREQPQIGIIVFTAHKNDVYVYQALEAGARGYALKGEAISRVVEAIQEVRRGGYWLSPELNRGIINSILKKPGQRPSELDTYRSLSIREQQVFRLLAKGKSTAEVADILHISPKTVAKHRVAVKEKLELNNVAEMANYAARIGLAEFESTLGS